MNKQKSNKTNRREFLKRPAPGIASFPVVPGFVLEGNGKQGTIPGNPFIGLSDARIIACSYYRDILKRVILYPAFCSEI